jgi:hypothetical protein
VCYLGLPAGPATLAIVAVPTVAPSVTKVPSTGPNSMPLPAARIGPGTNSAPIKQPDHERGECGEPHDVAPAGLGDASLLIIPDAIPPPTRNVLASG